jgi:hypothetical protein
MTRIFPLPHQDDYPSASLKNLDDAKTLLANNRYDGAGYHAGFVIECSLKAILQHNRHQAHGHDLQKMSEQALGLATLPQGSFAKYYPRILRSGNCTLVTCKEWGVNIRYKTLGLLPQQIATQWVYEADSFYQDSIGEMRKDGVIQ